MAESPVIGGPSFDFRSDLRGVTVRNTFLEFADTGRDEFFPDSGFMRQASEPAKSMNQDQAYSSWVDELTGGCAMTGSPVGAEQRTADGQGDGYAAQFNYFAAGPSSHDVSAADMVGAGGDAYPSAAALQAAFGAGGSCSCSCGSGGSIQSTMPPPVPTMPAGCGVGSPPRFCPHCGAEVAPNHRFCPYCCFQLHNIGGGVDGGCGGCGGSNSRGGVAQACLEMQPQLSGLFPQPCSAGGGGIGVWPPRGSDGCAAPSLLTNLRRFRYVEANEDDIRIAQTICQRVLHATAC